MSKTDTATCVVARPTTRPTTRPVTRPTARPTGHRQPAGPEPLSTDAPDALLGLRVAGLVEKAERLAAELRDQWVMGALRTFDRALESVVVDATTGEITATYEGHHAQDLLNLAPLTVPPPSLGALIRPLARHVRPAEGLAVDLPKRLLDEEFGAGSVVRFEDVDFPAGLTHEPTRRFLRETGLPENARVFDLDTDVPLPTLPEYYDEARPPEFTKPELPHGADYLIRLGTLVTDTALVVDGTTGEILTWNEPDRTLSPLNADISTLTFTVWLLHRERTLSAEPLVLETVAGFEPT
ncbi:SUKH-4 immunity protein [Actinobacteria bacterium OK074]|nr:SUKH-4 immunity protein [Actinobacteria bacterium OK074]